jgi:hypothetical protein
MVVLAHNPSYEVGIGRRIAVPAQLGQKQTNINKT